VSFRNSIATTDQKSAIEDKSASCLPDRVLHVVNRSWSAHCFTYSDSRATYVPSMLILFSTNRKTAIPVIEILIKLHKMITGQEANVIELGSGIDYALLRRM
jgi:hypothetical protein